MLSFFWTWLYHIMDHYRYDGMKNAELLIFYNTILPCWSWVWIIIHSSILESYECICWLLFVSDNKSVFYSLEYCDIQYSFNWFCWTALELVFRWFLFAILYTNFDFDLGQTLECIMCMIEWYSLYLLNYTLPLTWLCENTQNIAIKL